MRVSSFVTCAAMVYVLHFALGCQSSQVAKTQSLINDQLARHGDTEIDGDQYFVELKFWPAGIKPDVVIVWTGYSPNESDGVSDVTYWWNGDSIGEGAAGLGRVVGRVESLASGSIVFVPLIPSDWRSGSIPPYPVRAINIDLFHVIHGKVFVIAVPEAELRSRGLMPPPIRPL